MPKLQITVPNIGDLTHDLNTDEITLGRSSDNKIQIKDGSVSVRHARLIRSESGYEIEDLGSTNGTFVNGTQIRRRPLEESVALRFGNITAIFFADAVVSAKPPQTSDPLNLQNQLAAMREARDLIHARNEALVKERDAAVEARELAADEMAQCKAQAIDPQTVQRLKSELEAQKAGAEKVRAEAVRRSADLEKELSDLRTASAAAEKVRVEREREAEELRAAKSAAERQTLEAQVRDFTEKAEQADRLRAAAESSLANEKDRLALELETERAKSAELTATAAKAEETARGAEGTSEETSRQIQAMRAEIENARTHAARELEARAAEIGTLRQEQAAAAESAQDSLAEKTRLSEKNDALESERKRLAEALREAQAGSAELADLRAQLARAEKSAGEEAARSAELLSAARGQRASLDELEAKTAAATLEIGTLRESIAALEKERDDEIRHSTQAETKLRELEMKLRAESEKAGRERDKALSDLDAAMRRLTEADESIQSQVSEIDALHQKIEALEAAAQENSRRNITPVDDPFAPGRAGVRVVPEPALRPRRASAKIEQRLHHRGTPLGAANANIDIEPTPLWIGRKQQPASARDETPAVFPEDVVAQDTVTMAGFPNLIADARGDLQYLIRHPSDLQCLEKLRKKTRALSELARSTVFRAVYNIASALDSLLGDLHATPERINQATLRTVTQTFDFLLQLVEADRLARTLTLTEPHVLAIDDEPDVLDAIVSALEIVGLPASGTCDPQVALEELGREKFELIFLDVRLPEITGWDLCHKIRSVPEHRRTPIVFVTGMDSIENKVKSTLQGGNDFVGKPFNIRELGIKALSWVYRGQLGMI